MYGVLKCEYAGAVSKKPNTEHLIEQSSILGKKFCGPLNYLASFKLIELLPIKHSTFSRGITGPSLLIANIINITSVWRIYIKAQTWSWIQLLVMVLVKFGRTIVNEWSTHMHFKLKTFIQEIHSTDQSKYGKFYEHKNVYHTFLFF